jgi:hypothetical protein
MIQFLCHSYYSSRGHDQQITLSLVICGVLLLARLLKANQISRRGQRGIPDQQQSKICGDKHAQAPRT